MRNVGCLLLVLLTASAFGAIDIDVGRQLFVDDYLIETNTLVREWGRPVKYEGNPVLYPKTEAEKNEPYDSTARPNGGGMWWDAKKGVFRLWYEAGWLWSVAYAESEDGIHWTRPELDIVPGTNLVLPLDGSAPHPDSWSVVPDAHGEGWWMFLRQPGGDEQGYLYWSDDGLHWQFKCRTGVCGDRSTFFHDPFRGHYVYSLRAADAKAERARAYRAAVDPVAGAKWAWAGFAETAEVKPWIRTDARDLPEPTGPAAGRRPQLYNFDAVAYESLMVGAFEIHYGPENDICERAGLPKITDLQFAYSRDGFTYERPDRTAAIRSERWESDKWDRGYVQSLSNLMVVMGDELWLYYGAFRGDEGRLSCAREDAPWAGVNSPRNGMYHKGAMGLAKLRRDGFAALAAATKGFVQTKEVVFSGSRLYVNAVADSVVCEVLGARGEVLARRSLARVDATKALLGEVGEFASRPVRLRFTVANGRLYSFWVSAYPNGESGGYLAGGGPGYADLRDVPPPPSAARLAADFAVPPLKARPHTWYHMMNGNVTKEGITKDFEALARIGVGGVQMFDAGCDIPRGPMVFNSPEWMEMMRHAALEAKRLKLDIVIPNCSGWSSSGGPWIAPSNGMKRLVTSVTRVKGPGKVKVELPAADLGHGFYDDIAIMAFPTPAAELQALPALKESYAFTGEPVKHVYTFAADTPFVLNGLDYRYTLEYSWVLAPGDVRVEASDDGKAWREVIWVTTQFTLHGATDHFLRHLAFPRPERAKAFRFSFGIPEWLEGCTIADVRPTAGLRVTDLGAKRFDFRFQQFTADQNGAADAVVRSGSVRFLKVRPAADGSFDWEAPAGDWTLVRLGFSADGRKNHPASVTGEGLEVDKLDGEAVKFHFEQYVGKLCRYLGEELYGQDDYGFRGTLVDSYEVGSQNWTANLPEEFKRRRGYAMDRFYPALVGYVVESGETTDAFFYDFRKTVGELFAENYAGALAEKCHEYGLEFSLEPYGNCPCDNMSYGRFGDVIMGEFWSKGQQREPTAGNAKYVSSLCHVLGKEICGAEAFTAGGGGVGGRWQTTPYSIKHQGDVAYASGVNRIIYHRFTHQPWTDDRYRPGMTMGPWGMHFDRTQTWWELAKDWITYQSRVQALLMRGTFAADVLFFAGEEMPNECGSEDGADVAADYRLDAGWQADICNVDLFKELRVEDGKVVVPGGGKYELLALPHGEMKERALKEKLAELEQGGAKIVRGERVEAALKRFGIDKDAVIDFKGGVWIHRRSEGCDWYFVATPNDEERVITCSFRQTGRVPEIWDAETGAIGEAPKWREEGGRTIVEVAMRPNGSAFVVFPEKPTPKRGELFAVAGAKREPAKVAGKIKLSFPKAGAVELDRFVDWTTLKDFDQRHFSGTATYEFAVEGEGTLDLGEVKHFAEVGVDGGESAVMWRPPFRVQLKGAGVHRLVVKVTNLWPNRLIGDDYLEPNCVWENWTVKEIPAWVREGRDSPTAAKTFTTRRHWIKSDPLLPSGIIGPLTWRNF